MPGLPQEAKFRAPLAGRPIQDFGSFHQGAAPRLLKPLTSASRYVERLRSRASLFLVRTSVLHDPLPGGTINRPLLEMVYSEIMQIYQSRFHESLISRRGPRGTVTRPLFTTVSFRGSHT